MICSLDGNILVRCIKGFVRLLSLLQSKCSDLYQLCNLDFNMIYETSVIAPARSLKASPKNIYRADILGNVELTLCN